MGAIQQIFHRFGPEYLARFGEHIPAQHHKVIEAICQCRTEAYGSVCYQCEDCGHHHVLPAACGNRHWQPSLPPVPTPQDPAVA